MVDPLRRSISQLSRALLAAGCVGNIPNHRKVWELVLLGKIPAEQVNGRWFYRNDDLPEIARTLNLSMPVCANSDSVGG